jgi:hypothetical protein
MAGKKSKKLKSGKKMQSTKTLQKVRFSGT